MHDHELIGPRDKTAVSMLYGIFEAVIAAGALAVGGAVIINGLSEWNDASSEKDSNETI